MGYRTRSFEKRDAAKVSPPWLDQQGELGATRTKAAG